MRISNELQVEEDRYQVIRNYTDDPNKQIKAEINKEIAVMKMQFGAGFGSAIGEFKADMGQAIFGGLVGSMSDDPSKRFRGGGLETAARSLGYGHLSAEAQQAINPLQYILTEIGETFGSLTGILTLLAGVLVGVITVSLP